MSAVEHALLGVFGISVAAYAALFFLEKPTSPPIPVPALPWWQSLLRELDGLQGQAHRDHPKEAMIQFSRLLDDYVHRAYRLDSTPLTTREITQALSGKASPDAIRKVVSLLEGSDLVKFAKHRPSEEEWQELFQTFRELLLAVHAPGS